ncbi:MAG: hypothetical protein H6654_16175 [Ardenticatenaceae bacterium]|nr:hypothetical protein [Anaerolineales bacterium]MCB8939821.1 hypothetical protein [Ardenticatenaceae bacterium]MCB8975096.1 hypothetical protein [Ardenticatenaceae bacterium]
MKTTNYFNTLIEVAEDCPATHGEIPPEKGNKTVANLQYELLHNHPYQFTSDDVLFAVFAQRNQIPEEELAGQRELFFAKGQACFRASPLPKRYGWGVHSNDEGKIALFGMESDAYQDMVTNKAIDKTKAMRSARA